MRNIMLHYTSAKKEGFFLYEKIQSGYKNECKTQIHI